MIIISKLVLKEQMLQIYFSDKQGRIHGYLSRVRVGRGIAALIKKANQAFGQVQ